MGRGLAFQVQVCDSTHLYFQGHDEVGSKNMELAEQPASFACAEVDRRTCLSQTKCMVKTDP